jgi:hypothetical protein
MRHLRLTLAVVAGLAVCSIGAFAAGDQGDVLDSAAARSGAERAGGVEVTSPPHASTATGQQPTKLSTADTRKSKHPASRSVVGPPPAKPAAQTKK